MWDGISQLLHRLGLISLSVKIVNTIPVAEHYEITECKVLFKVNILRLVLFCSRTHAGSGFGNVCMKQ